MRQLLWAPSNMLPMSSKAESVFSAWIVVQATAAGLADHHNLSVPQPKFDKGES